MKIFKSALSVIAILLLCCVEVLAADSNIRIGVEDFWFSSPETDISKHSTFSVASVQQKNSKKYKKMFIDLLSKTNGFEGGNLQLEVVDYQLSGRNLYRRSITETLTTSPKTQQEAMKMHMDQLRNAARRNKYNYIFRGHIIFKNSSKSDVEATVNFSINEVISDRNFEIFSDVKVPLSAVKPQRGKGSRGSKDSSTNEQSAREHAALLAFNKALQYFRYEITEDYPKILSVDGDNITINKGSDSFMSAGDKFFVMLNNEEVNDIFGENLQSSNLAIIVIKSVQKNSSTAEIYSNLGNISTLRPDDILRPVNNMIVDNYLSNKFSFPDKRPEIAAAPSSSQAPANVEPIPALPPGMIRVGVVNFDSKAAGIPQKGASTLSDLLSRMLANSDKIAVLERSQLNAIAREHKLNLSGLIDPATAAQIGKLASCQYILIGSVTGCEERDTVSGRYIRPTESANFSRYNTANMSSKAAGVLLGLEIIALIAKNSEAQKENIVIETHEVITEIDARLINVQTSQIIAVSVKGSAAQSDVITQDGNGQIKHVEANYGDLSNRAIASTAANLGQRIREVLANELVQITSVNDGEIIINRGSSSGIQVDDLFCVYSEDQSGGDTEAIISIKDVQESFSTAEIAKSIYDPYSPAVGSRLEPVLHSDFQRGIWHIKNQKRLQAQERNKDNVSLESLSSGTGRKKRLENASTDPKKVIKTYGLKPNEEKSLINAHVKASKASSAKNKYEAYKKISDANINDYLAAYNTGKYALDQSMYIEAREWASKALFANPNYKPAKDLIEKIDKGN
ncbi:MAG: hypothetical protein IJT21_07295 [Synergistaceae bacterium]|nr:hypothetical protein [Synergistaceae bacterium]